jgi:hypothetical protein
VGVAVCCDTGLPSRSALVAPPLRLAALRWRVAPVFLGRSRPPPSVSTAFLVAVARFSEARSPRIATLENVPTQDRGVSSTFSRSGTSHRCAPIRSPVRACGSRAPLKEIRSAFGRRAAGGCPAPVPRVPDVGRCRTPAGARLHVSSGERDSRALRSTRRGATVARCVRGPWRGASHFAGSGSVAGMSFLLQR